MKKVDHIGIAVRSLKETLPFYENILGFTCTAIENVPSEHVNVAFLDASNVRIELLEATSSNSSIAKFIEKRGEGIHHLALKVDSIEKRISDLKKNGIQMLNDVPKEGAAGAMIAFIHPKSTHGVLYEICEKKPLKENDSD
ncbi:methylmalonyl-CoA epimerase [Bacillus sp. FJAT-49732]|uniref:Methylmalonyl-CoA epimerase n=1 Tax=Lederbergia citrisecunda TaxID=2833583 RepID=A0A942YMR7_9BACI|nr:methylmalonyl-CoA epimerase [Lederbergia citrisecunda]MBS4199596.1 methylmalonyl-CoA epimerase [Lederbergia citrisecunda]